MAATVGHLWIARLLRRPEDERRELLPDVVLASDGNLRRLGGGDLGGLLNRWVSR
jgi:hypothetical protein